MYDLFLIVLGIFYSDFLCGVFHIFFDDKKSEDIKFFRKIISFLRRRNQETNGLPKHHTVGDQTRWVQVFLHAFCGFVLLLYKMNMFTITFSITLVIIQIIHLISHRFPHLKLKIIQQHVIHHEGDSTYLEPYRYWSMLGISEPLIKMILNKKGQFNSTKIGYSFIFINLIFLFTLIIIFP